MIVALSPFSRRQSYPTTYPEMRIKKASIASGVSFPMIRHYEKLGLLPLAARGPNGYRDYTEDDVKRLQFIFACRNLGFEIEDIRDFLSLWGDDDRSAADVRALALAKACVFERKAALLETTRAAFLELAEQCKGSDRPAQSAPKLRALTA